MTYLTDKVIRKFIYGIYGLEGFCKIYIVERHKFGIGSNIIVNDYRIIYT